MWRKGKYTQLYIQALYNPNDFMSSLFLSMFRVLSSSYSLTCTGGQLCLSACVPVESSSLTYLAVELELDLDCHLLPCTLLSLALHS